MLQFTTIGILMALSGLAQSSTVTSIDSNLEAEGAKTSSIVLEEDVEEFVREYFKDTPILADVARCESTFRHLGKDGYVIRGIVDKRDVGVMQINEGYHLETANKLGHNIYTLEGNMDYAKLLYQKFGLSPWKASSKCWLKNLELAYR